MAPFVSHVQQSLCGSLPRATKTPLIIKPTWDCDNADPSSDIGHDESKGNVSKPSRLSLGGNRKCDLRDLLAISASRSKAAVRAATRGRILFSNYQYLHLR